MRFSLEVLQPSLQEMRVLPPTVLARASVIGKAITGWTAAFTAART